MRINTPSRQNRFKLLWAYFLSPVAVAFLSVTLVGIVLFLNSSEVIDRIENKQAHNRARLAANYFADQYDAMKEVAATIRISRVYQYTVVHKSHFYDIDLVKDLAKYANYSAIADSYFFLYPGEKRIYLSEGKTMDFDIYVRNHGISNADGNLYDILQHKEEFAIHSMIIDGSEKYLFSFRIYTESSNTPRSRATLCFVVSPELTRHRLEAVLGEWRARMTVYYQDAPVMEIPDAQGSNDIYASSIDSMSDDGLFQISYRMVNSFSEPRYYSVIYVIYFCLAVLGAIGAALLIGARNYRPLRKLLEKLGGIKGEPIESLEINYVTALIDKIDENKRELESEKEKAHERYELAEAEINKLSAQFAEDRMQSSKEIQRLFGLARKQILRMLLQSDPIYGKLAASSVLGINMSGPYYLVAAAVFEEEPEEKITESVPGEESGAYQVVFVETQDRRVYSAIVNLDSADDAEIAVIHMETLLNVSSWRHCLSTSLPFTDISEMPSQYMRALSEATKRLNKLKGQAYGTDETDTSERERLHAVKDEETRRQESAVLAHINDNFDRWNFDLEELVGLMGISKRTAARIVKEKTGKQFREYVISLRIERAKELLQTGEKIGDISKKVGYSYTHYFIQSFKKATGMTPGEWVKRGGHNIDHSIS